MQVPPLFVGARVLASARPPTHPPHHGMNTRRLRIPVTIQRRLVKLPDGRLQRQVQVLGRGVQSQRHGWLALHERRAWQTATSRLRPLRGVLAWLRFRISGGRPRTNANAKHGDFPCKPHAPCELTVARACAATNNQPLHRCAPRHLLASLATTPWTRA